MYFSASLLLFATDSATNTDRRCAYPSCLCWPQRRCWLSACTQRPLPRCGRRTRSSTSRAGVLFLLFAFDMLILHHFVHAGCVECNLVCSFLFCCRTCYHSRPQAHHSLSTFFAALAASASRTTPSCLCPSTPRWCSGRLCRCVIIRVCCQCAFSAHAHIHSRTHPTHTLI
jgi:hypothetical protein